MPMIPEILMEGFKVGCDPELFVFDPNGEPVPAGRFFPGTKEEPHKVELGAVQVDGFAAEFNIEPVSTFDDFNRNILKVLAAMKSYLPKDYKLVPTSAVHFAPDVFDSAPDDQKILGCQPDFNAWTGEINPPPFTEPDPYLRTAAGHLHIGWTEDAEFDDTQHVINCRDLVKQLDWYLGVWSTKVDSDPTRRNLYGKSGACRIKPYGVEYRVLGNFWVMDKGHRLNVWNRLCLAIDDMRKNFLPERASKYNVSARNAIDRTRYDSLLESVARYPIGVADRRYA